MLYISENRPNFKSLWSEVELLLADIPERAVLLLQLPDFYQEKTSKPFPLDSVQINQFLKNIPSNFLVSIFGIFGCFLCEGVCCCVMFENM